MRHIWLFCLLSSIPLSSTSQNNDEKEELIEENFYKAVELGKTQRDSSYYYYNQAFQYAKDLGKQSDMLEILFGSIMTSRKFSDLINHQLLIVKIDSILSNKTRIKGLENLDYFQNRFTYQKATYQYNLKDYTSAMPFFQKLHSNLSKQESTKTDIYDYSILIHTTNYIALIYSHTGKFEMAENYFNRSLDYIANNPIDGSETYKRATLQLLAQLYRFTKNYSRSNDILREVLVVYKDLYITNKGYKNNVNAAYHKLVENAIDQDSLHIATIYLEQGRKYLLNKDPFYKKYLLLYGTIYNGLGETVKAQENYDEALRIFKEYRQNKPHQDIAEVHGKIAEFYLKQKKYQVGLETIQKAFNTAGNNIQISSFKDNPNPEEVFSKTQLLHLLDIKLQLLEGSFEDNRNANYLKAALQTSRDILKTFDLLKSEFDSKLDKQFLSEKAYPIFHRMMKNTFKTYQKNRSSETLQLALNIAEKNKDFMLLEALRNAQATQYGDIPKKVLNKETQLRAEITNLEKQMFDATESENGYSDALFKRKQEYYAFLDTIKTKYPKYHELKYLNKNLDLATVRENILNDNSTLISYTMTKDYVYAIVINKSKEKILKLPFKETDREAIRNFYRLLSSPSISGAEKEISVTAHRLFEKIIKEPLVGFDSENLTIIPDGELHYLPFDLLQENGSYLLQTKNISYGNSVTSLQELKEKGSAETNKMLAFAPSFSGVATANTNRQFGKLLYNDNEVEKIGAFYDTETLLKNEATLDNFISKTPKFNILHLATHASANDEYPDYSYLAFSENNTNTSNVLYIKDLYNMTLNADMVTLSACQTGIGKLQKGQGMLSLSKGFYYAGAKSLVNTLWKINDKSTVKLMEYFYEGLSKGYSKSEALRKAKLKYLETTEDELLKHPYYWAAFVVSGDISPISNNNNLWWFVGLAAITILLIVIFLKRKKNIKNI